MARGIKYLLVVIIVISLTACSRRAEALQGVYATAYTILTETASAVAKIPTNTPDASKETATIEAALAASVTPIATATPLPTVSPVTATAQVNTTPVPQLTAQPTATTIIPTQRPQTIPTNPQVFPTATPFIPTATSASPTSTPGIQPPQQGLLGLWQEAQTGATFQFNTDGTYRLANSYSGMQADFIDDGQYTVQGTQVTLAGTNSSPSCKGVSGIYELQIPTTTSQRQFNLSVDTCFDRQRVVSGKTWYWLPVKIGATPVATTAVEQPIRPVPIQGAMAVPNAKISGMAWHNDNLIFLPQDPTFVADGKSYLFTLSRADLTNFLNNLVAGPLTPQSILFNDSGITTQLTGFQGYQAAATIGDKIYLIARSDSGSGPRSYIVAGNIASDLSSITLDTTKIIEIPAQPGSPTRTYRALLVSDNTLLAIPELNGVATNPGPVAQRFDTGLTNLAPLQLPVLEYPVTDAMSPDANGRAWILNKFSPGDPGALPGPDPLAQLYGEGITHQVFDYTERLVAYQFTASGINLAAIPPIQLELSARGPRNWQGIASVGTQGFLIITNQLPETILGYVPSP